MNPRNRSSSNSTPVRLPRLVVIDFFSRYLDRFELEDIQLILGQMIFGLIHGQLMQQYGKLVAYFVRENDSACLTSALKLTYVDEIFAECQRNLGSLDTLLKVYRHHDVVIEDVHYNRDDHYVSFVITTERAFCTHRRRKSISRFDRELGNDGRTHV